MAEVRHCAGRGACEFGLKMFKCCLLENRIRLGTNVGHLGSLSAGFVFDDTRNCERSGAAGVAQRRPAAGYTKPLLGGAAAGLQQRRMPRKLRCLGHKKNECVNGPLEEATQRNVPLHRSCEKFWRTLSLFPRSQSPSGPDPGAPRLVFTRNYSGNGSRSEPLHRTRTGYYDVLGVAPTATQAQIKTAYYKLSFACHPDRNPGSEAATERFSEISEAYTVLGNKGLRKKYDRGLLSLSDLTGRARPSTGVLAEQQPGSRRSVMGADFRERIFDFDQFYKSHYGEQLQRQRDVQARREEMLKRRGESIGDKKLGRMLELGVGILVVFAVGILYSLGQ